MGVLLAPPARKIKRNPAAISGWPQRIWPASIEPARAAFEDADYSAALEGYRRAKILDAHGQWTETIEEALGALESRSQENSPSSPAPAQRSSR